MSQEHLHNELKMLQRKLDECVTHHKKYVGDIAERLCAQITAIKAALDILNSESGGELNAYQRDFLKKAQDSVDQLNNLLKEKLDVTRLPIDRLIDIQSSAETLPPSAPKTILIIDDEANLVDLIKFQLKNKGFNVVTAYDGLAGLEKLKSIRPDLIILDINMPKMNGFEFYGKITMKHGRTRYPVLVLTSRAHLQESFQQIEAAGFMPKPFEVSDLISEAERITALPPQPLVVLVARKDQARNKEIHQAFKERNFDVAFINDSKELRELSEHARPAAVLVEYAQGLFEGDVLVQQLKDSVSGDDVPVVAYSVNASKEIEDRCLRAGADRFIKPAGDFSGLVTFVSSLREPKK